MYNMDNNTFEKQKQYSIERLNKLIAKIEDLRDNQIESEIKHRFFELSILLDEWQLKTIYMSKYLDFLEGKERPPRRRNATSDSDEELHF